MIKNVAFEKTHKCGSQSLKHILIEFTKQNNLVVATSTKKLIEKLREVYDQGKSLQYAKKEGLIFALGQATSKGLKNRDYNIIAEHIPYDDSFYRWLVKDPAYITFVREPLQRTISSYYFTTWKKLKKKISFDEYYKRNNHEWKGSMWENYFSKFLGYKTEQEITLKSLNERFAVIGMTERFDDSICKIEKAFGWTIERPYERQNITNCKPKKIVISEETRQLFKMRNNSDYKLYNLIKNNFDK